MFAHQDMNYAPNVASMPSSKLSHGLRQQQQEDVDTDSNAMTHNGLYNQNTPNSNTNSNNTNTSNNNGNSAMLKNLSHVPCKFFRQGQCQAGTGCPFSHTLNALEQTPCKYFQKGNCKFGMKCALAHVLPDGRIVNMKSLQHNQLQKNHHNQHQRMMSTGAPTGPNDFISHHSQQQQQSLQPFTNNGITNSGPASDPPVLSQGPTTSATIRNIYMSAASAAYNGTPDYTQNLSSTPTSSSLSSPSIAAVANTKNKPAVISEDGPVIGSVPLVHHHKAASFIIPSTTTAYPDYNPSSQQQQTQQYASSQASSASSAALHQHRQQKAPLQPQPQPQPQHQSQRSFSASASIWNSNPIPSSLRQNPVSMLASSFSNVQINNHQEFLENHEFAIDDDDDGLEDFVPSSLTDLLTDKERQRRGSRPSSSAHPTLNSANPRMSFSNANTAIWASNSPRTFARRHLGDVDGLSLNGDSVVGYGSPLRSSFSLSSNNGTINSSFNGMALPPPIGTPEGGSSYMASYKSQLLANNSHQQSKSSLVVGVGSSVLSDDGVTGILTPNDIDTKNNNGVFNENNAVTPTVAKSTLVTAGKYVGTDERSKGNDGSSATSPSNEPSEFDETQFEMDEDVPKVQSEFGLAR